MEGVCSREDRMGFGVYKACILSYVFSQHMTIRILFPFKMCNLRILYQTLYIGNPVGGRWKKSTNNHRRAIKLVKLLYGPRDCPSHVSATEKRGLPRVSLNFCLKSTGMAQVGPLLRWTIELKNTRHKILIYWQFTSADSHRTMGRGIGISLSKFSQWKVSRQVRRSCLTNFSQSMALKGTKVGQRKGRYILHTYRVGYK